MRTAAIRALQLFSFAVSSTTPGVLLSRSVIWNLRGVSSFRDRSPGKDRRFPFKLSKNGAENSKRIVRAAPSAEPLSP